MTRCNSCRTSWLWGQICCFVTCWQTIWHIFVLSSSWDCALHALSKFECHRLWSVMSGTPMIPDDVPMTPETDDLCYLSTTPCPFGNCSACLWAPILWSPYMEVKVLPVIRKLVLKKGKAPVFQACARSTRLKDTDKDSLLQALGPWQRSST